MDKVAGITQVKPAMLITKNMKIAKDCHQAGLIKAQ
ncbi:hypothetical protein SVI_3625 [Shewanella violacea DSS12]|uniref:Uncharacterized protein n=1 Tax=Shewanella violacea (strain JCM 10179 / CIP 106290 / LMG 19151 / DSS12) TaxID=637905 RepID=D4ZC51_SHEVD|nr:hypothetical protein SVI_3625 [Shewanella violacea DSS12]